MKMFSSDRPSSGAQHCGLKPTTSIYMTYLSLHYNPSQQSWASHGHIFTPGTGPVPSVELFLTCLEREATSPTAMLASCIGFIAYWQHWRTVSLLRDFPLCAGESKSCKQSPATLPLSISFLSHPPSAEDKQQSEGLLLFPLPTDTFSGQDYVSFHSCQRSSLPHHSLPEQTPHIKLPSTFRPISALGRKPTKPSRCLRSTIPHPHKLCLPSLFRRWLFKHQEMVPALTGCSCQKLLFPYPYLADTSGQAGGRLDKSLHSFGYSRFKYRKVFLI